MAYAEEDWRNGLCSHVCGGDCGTCMGAWCCSCFLFGRTASRMNHFPEDNKDVCNLDCFLLCAAGCLGVHCLPVCMKRSDLRKQHHIKGDGCADCMVAWCCLPCALAQMETEVKDRAETARSGQAPYKSQQPMQYYPQ